MRWKMSPKVAMNIQMTMNQKEKMSVAHMKSPNDQSATITASSLAVAPDELPDGALALSRTNPMSCRAGPPSRDEPVTVQAKMLRLELRKAKADLERELAQLVLDCSACGRLVHRVVGLGVTPGHWAHREPAPHVEPAI